MKFSVPDHQKEYKLGQKKYTEIGYPGGKSVKVYEDGSSNPFEFSVKQ